jgi:hypothetical protein
MIDELRELHLGVTRPDPDAPRASDQLNAAYQAALLDKTSSEAPRVMIDSRTRRFARGRLLGRSRARRLSGSTIPRVKRGPPVPEVPTGDAPYLPVRLGMPVMGSTSLRLVVATFTGSRGRV